MSDTQSPQHSSPPSQPALPVSNRFLDLPSEILHAVFGKLPIRALVRLTDVNRDLRELILNGPWLWREFHWVDLEEGMLDEGFFSFAEKYFKNGRLLQYVSLDFANAQVEDDDEIGEIDMVFEYFDEHDCT